MYLIKFMIAFFDLTSQYIYSQHTVHIWPRYTSHLIAKQLSLIPFVFLSAGRRKIFSEAEEKVFANYCEVMAEWGFPLDRMDLRLIIKSYIDRERRSEPRFQNNMPGEDWVKSFIARQSDTIKEKLASNVKRSHAAVSREVINDYFDNLKIEVEGIPAENIWNFDETNLTDDPGRKKCVVRRSCKYPERIINSSKGSTSLMFCGSAAGVLLPPYVVYKGERMYDAYAEGGPSGECFNVTKSGWFDMTIFEDWFQNIFLHADRKLQGRKILLADNLSSHVSLEVLRLCQKFDIHLIFLPANSTHLLQPLDVAFFAPMKRAWREILNEWRGTNEGRKLGALPKVKFPVLLKKLFCRIAKDAQNILKAGFKKTGIYPLDKEEVLRSLPRDNLSPNDAVSEIFLEHLKQLRYGDEPARKRKKRLNVPAGKSVTPEDVIQAQSSLEEGPPAKKVNSHRNEIFSGKEVAVGQYMVISYEGELYPGKIIDMDAKEKSVTVSCLRKSKKHWKWPEVEDKILNYDIKDIVMTIRPPKNVNKRAILRVKELEYLWGNE